MKFQSNQLDFNSFNYKMQSDKDTKGTLNIIVNWKQIKQEQSSFSYHSYWKAKLKMESPNDAPTLQVTAAPETGVTED